MKVSRNRSTRLPRAFALSILACSIHAAFAADATDLGTVSAQGDGDNVPSKAAAVAPTQASLKATQPQSIISRDFFALTKNDATDFTGLAAIAPSVSGGISPNGPGLGESKVSLRGFQDGQYNVTFDGIPFGDTNGPTHHSTAYFPAIVVGGVTVERGPGNASNLGQATFGGSINMFSRDLANEFGGSTSFAFGSWNTHIFNARADSGLIGENGDTKFAFSYQNISSDGYRTNNSLNGSNYMFKAQKTVGESTVLTLFLNHNANDYYAPDKDNGLTMAQVQQFGKNFGLGNDPTKANYFGYNRTDKNTDFHYIGIQSDLGNGWSIDNKTYYYDYDNITHTGGKTADDPTLALSTATKKSPYVKVNGYQVYGNIFKADKQFDAGTLRAGLWLEEANTNRALFDYSINPATGVWTPHPGLADAAAGTNIQYQQTSGWTQYQPFTEFEWKATDALTITPGLKYMNTSLHVGGPINQTSQTNDNINKDFTKVLPFLTANYRWTPTLSTYAQYAKGMLVPDISSYQDTTASNANATSIQPQTTTNYQLGLVQKADRLVFDTDVYYINFNNRIATNAAAATDPTAPSFINQGGVIFKGIEGELTYAFDHGIAAFVNGSINKATKKDTGLWVANAPRSTFAGGALYNNYDWHGAIVYKRTGSQYALDDSAYRMSAFSTTDLTIARDIIVPNNIVHKISVKFAVYNVFNQQNIISVNPSNTTEGTAGYGSFNAADTFLFQPGRSFMTTVSANF